VPDPGRTPQRYVRGELVVVIDCTDLDRSAEFWTTVLGYVRSGPPAPPYQSLLPADGIGCELLLQRVPEAKRGKNRLHLDLRTRDLASEVERVLRAGAESLTEEPIVEADWRWHILADPDGNEFCVLQPPPSWRT
jgi:catechol 2,3-dioxygenase-like lactoylglutathione lyase family enzyme